MRIGLLAGLLSLLALAPADAAVDDNLRCLRGVQAALDREGSLNATWNLSNTTVGAVCNFVGVSCWNPQENRVLSLALPSMSLSGALPSDLQHCFAMTTLDLSSNALSGPIPPALCDWLPFLVKLDLSSNSFSGPIPSEFSRCRYLNTLLLDNNSLSGTIPQSLARLDRLRQLSLADNQLSGPIPIELSSLGSSLFAGNPSLCGRPVSTCSSLSSRGLLPLFVMIAAGVSGYVASLIISYAVWRRHFSATNPKKRRNAAVNARRGAQYNDNRMPASFLQRGILMANLAKLMAKDARRDVALRSWADQLQSPRNRLVLVKIFGNRVAKVKLADLMDATSNFRSDYIVTAGSARTGTSYKAVLRDGSALTVKRLHGCALTKKQFRTGTGRLGRLRHPNLVPLLGFCVVEDERLLVYKHTPSGALSDILSDLDWPARLRIGIGTARGLAWLHHGFRLPFLHQSVTSAAVLLDEDYEPRITDFGFARILRSTSSGKEPSPVMNGGFMELGYIPPEYASDPMPTTKADVYSFGVVLLELVTGQKPTKVSNDAAGEGFRGSLVEWVNQLYGAHRISDAIDRTLRGKGHDQEIMQFLVIARACVVARPKERPSMYKVYQSLKNIGERHGFFEELDEFPLNFGKEDPETP